MSQNGSLPKITDAEWHVMQLLWESSPRTAKELSACMTTKFGWAGNTTYTLIYRLLDKGAVRQEGTGHGKLYYACVSEDEAAMQAASALIERAYRGNAVQLVRELASHGALSEQDKLELRQVLGA